jgi:hypothetical protein
MGSRFWFPEFCCFCNAQRTIPKNWFNGRDTAVMLVAGELYIANGPKVVADPQLASVANASVGEPFPAFFWMKGRQSTTE